MTDLKTLAGDRYRITWETPIDEKPDLATKRDPWATLIPTKTGHLFPWGSDTMGVWVEGRRPAVVRDLLAIGATIHTGGSDGTTLVCPVSAFEHVAQITKARKRRKLSPDARAKLISVGRPFPRKHEAQSDFRGLVCPRSTPDGQ